MVACENRVCILCTFICIVILFSYWFICNLIKRLPFLQLIRIMNYVGIILAPSCVIVLSSYVSSTWAKCSLSRGRLNCRFFCAAFFRFGTNGFFVPWSCIDRIPEINPFGKVLAYIFINVRLRYVLTITIIIFIQTKYNFDINTANWFIPCFSRYSSILASSMASTGIDRQSFLNSSSTYEWYQFDHFVHSKFRKTIFKPKDFDEKFFIYHNVRRFIVVEQNFLFIRWTRNINDFICTSL